MAGRTKGQVSGATVLGAFGLTAALVQAFGFAQWAGVLMVIANLFVVWQAIVRWARRVQNERWRTYRDGSGVVIREKVRGVDGGLYSACTRCGAVNDEPCDAGLHS